MEKERTQTQFILMPHHISHPQYQFEGVDFDDLSHFTNRAPYPTIHLIRQAQMTKALAHVADPQQIYADNIETLNKLGREKVESLCPWGK